MKSFVLACVLFSMALALGAKKDVDYCKESLCRGRQHIGCHNNGELAPRCGNDTEQIINLTPKLKDDIVHRHNEKRNKVASGKQEYYQPAARMATMTWDKELASLAELNVKTCVYAHDACRNTDTFSYSGQNLAFWAGYPAITIEKAVEKFIDMWYSEYAVANMAVIKSYHTTKKPNGHFTVMVADRNIKVGCALRRIVEGPFTKYFFSCNYATTNMMNFPIYTPNSRAASGCKTGTNPRYPALCSLSEQYDVNQWF